jgi:hypothetical protein
MLKFPVITGRLAPYRFYLAPKVRGIGLPPTLFENGLSGLKGRFPETIRLASRSGCGRDNSNMALPSENPSPICHNHCFRVRFRLQFPDLSCRS